MAFGWNNAGRKSDDVMKNEKGAASIMEKKKVIDSELTFIGLILVTDYMHIMHSTAPQA